MSFIDECDVDAESIVQPPSNGCIHENVLVIFEDRIMDIIKRLYHVKQIATIKECAPTPVYEIDLGGECISVFQTPIGAPATAIFMERAIAFGGKRFLFFGSCGSIDENIGSGEIIIPMEAYRGEGTSYHYMPKSDYIEMQDPEKLCNLLREEAIDFKQGKVWSTDAMFRETRELIKRRAAEGCIAVEMECSLIFALAKRRNVQAFSILFTDDVIADSEWKQFPNSKVLNDRIISKVIKITSKLSD